MKWPFTCVSYAEARNRYRLDVCLSVCPSVRQSHAGTVSKRLNILSCFLHPFILVLCVPRSSRNSDGVTPAGALNKVGYKNCAIFYQLVAISRKRYKVSPWLNLCAIRDLSNGAISNDLEWTLTLFSRSGHSLTLNISQTATDTAIVTIEGE